MKNLFKLFGLISLVTIATSAIARPSKIDAEDYESNYYAAEGSILFKLRASGIITQSKAKNFPPARKQPSKPVGHMLRNGLGIQGSTTVFFTDNIGAELGLGVMALRTSSSAMKAASYNFGTDAPLLKRRDLLGIPLDFLLQYHVAPFGAIRPYLGAGYQGVYFYSKSRAYKIGNAHGPAFQVGVDFVMKDDTMLNFDVKRYSLSPKITYTSSLLGGKPPVSGKLKMDPIIVSVGVGFKF